MITFTRNSEGGFTKVDNWPVGRKLAQIQIGDKRPYGKMSLSEAVEVIENAIAKGQAPAQVYTIIPLKADPMPPEVKELLDGVRAEKKNGVQNHCSFEGCEVTYPRNKGRYQNRLCPKHRAAKKINEALKPAATELD